MITNMEHERSIEFEFFIYVTKNEKIAQKVKTIKFKFMQPIDSSWCQ